MPFRISPFPVSEKKNARQSRHKLSLVREFNIIPAALMPSTLVISRYPRPMPRSNIMMNMKMTRFQKHRVSLSPAVANYPVGQQML
ncbi:hypothetical protein BKI51_02675 [Alphaproteobacteria bacterium AO1-B]|nr:hypothetical protein BKI51_02675 [Alphaproteobacteria bacterium AO1-B]